MVTQAKALKFKDQAAQGDVFLKRIPKLPAGAVEMKRTGGAVVVAFGTATGHSHAIKEKHVKQYRPKETKADAQSKLRTDGALAPITYVVVKGKVATLVHDEHTAIQLAPGVYEARIQREYVDREIRNVAD